MLLPLCFDLPTSPFAADSLPTRLFTNLNIFPNDTLPTLPELSTMNATFKTPPFAVQFTETNNNK